MTNKKWIILGLVAVGASILIWKRDKIFNKSEKVDEGSSSAQGETNTSPCPDSWNGYVCTGKWKRNEQGICYCHNGDLVPQSWMKRRNVNR
jgi:hypothetical protein